MNKITVLCIAILLTGCGANYHRNQVQDDTINNMTVGSVQREIKVGMSSADVVVALGSPNIVSTDEESREVWIYDKISTTHVKSVTSGGGGLLLILAGAGWSSQSGAHNTTQRTLTVIVKFDHVGAVRDVSYHTSRF